MSFLFIFPITVFGASKPFGLDLPEPTTGNPISDCDQTIQNWDFPEKVVLGRKKEHLFLVIDRYGGERKFPDYRGAMCRVKDMYEQWSVYELFPELGNISFTDDGKYFVNGIGNVTCDTVEDLLDIERLEVLVFHSEGEPIKGYFISDLLPGWRQICGDKGFLQWLSMEYSFADSVSENNTTFILKTSDGITHYFDIKSGNKINSPIDPIE